MLLSEAFGRWLEATDAKPTTKTTYAACIRRWMGSGIYSLSDVTVENVGARIRAQKKRGLGIRSISVEMAAMIAVLNQATLERLYPLEELALIRRLKPKDKALRALGTARWLTQEELARLIGAAAVVSPRMELPIRVAALCGPRVGELARMRREDFILGSEPHVRIENMHEHGERGTAKTGARTVPVCSELKELILSRGPKTGWLFPNSERKGGRAKVSPFLGRYSFELDMAYIRRAARLGEDVCFTTLRHTRASTWLQAGVSIWKVSVWLGHSVRVCERAYSGIGKYDPDCERMPAA